MYYIAFVPYRSNCVSGCLKIETTFMCTYVAQQKEKTFSVKFDVKSNF